MDIGTEMTVCSSIYMKSFIMEQSLFQFLARDGRPWFSLYFLQLDETSLRFPLSLAVHGIYTHLTQEKWKYALFGAFLITFLIWCISLNKNAHKCPYLHLLQVTATPLQWNHACIGIDTNTGHTTVAINDRIVHDEVLEYFKDSSSDLPRNLTEKIVLGKWYFQVRTLTFHLWILLEHFVFRKNGFRVWEL